MIITSEGSTQLWNCPAGEEYTYRRPRRPGRGPAHPHAAPYPPTNSDRLHHQHRPRSPGPAPSSDPAAIDTAFKANPHKAVQDYKGLWVEAYETIYEIHGWGVLFTSMVTGYLTRCNPMPGQDDKLAALTVGQRITVWGEIYMELGFEAVDVSLQNCIIVSS